MARDLSATGIRFHSRSKFAIGEQVVILFRMDNTVLSSVTGRVVRSTADQDYWSLFPNVTAVQFDVPYLDLELNG